MVTAARKLPKPEEATAATRGEVTAGDSTAEEALKQELLHALADPVAMKVLAGRRLPGKQFRRTGGTPPKQGEAVCKGCQHQRHLTADTRTHFSCSDACPDFLAANQAACRDPMVGLVKSNFSAGLHEAPETVIGGGRRNGPHAADD